MTKYEKRERENRREQEGIEVVRERESETVIAKERERNEENRK